MTKAPARRLVPNLLGALSPRTRWHRTAACHLLDGWFAVYVSDNLLAFRPVVQDFATGSHISTRTGRLRSSRFSCPPSQSISPSASSTVSDRLDQPFEMTIGCEMSLHLLAEPISTTLPRSGRFRENGNHVIVYPPLRNIKPFFGGTPFLQPSPIALPWNPCIAFCRPVSANACLYLP